MEIFLACFSIHLLLLFSLSFVSVFAAKLAANQPPGPETSLRFRDANPMVSSTFCASLSILSRLRTTKVEATRSEKDDTQRQEKYSALIGQLGDQLVVVVVLVVSDFSVGARCDPSVEWSSSVNCKHKEANKGQEKDESK